MEKIDFVGCALPCAEVEPFLCVKIRIESIKTFRFGDYLYKCKICILTLLKQRWIYEV